jgi:Cys-tRNA(Pro)/Cys-tRNA(Cys) deacylase
MTPAIKLLEKRKIPHQVLRYAHDPKTESYGEEAARALGLDAAGVFKTLVVDIDAPLPVVALVPVADQLDLKSLANAAGGKRGTMCEPKTAERLTGYLVGGISPLGQKKRLRTFVDDSARDLPEIYVSAGRRGLEIGLSPSDLLSITGASYAPLARAAKLPGTRRASQAAS